MMLFAAKFWLCKLVLLGLSAAAEGGQGNDRPDVATQYGRVRGSLASVDGMDRPVNVFLGIPFAKPPLGDLRFSPPQPPEPWSDVRESSYPPMCPQDLKLLELLKTMIKGNYPNVTLSEDCLYLNIFSPNLEARLPVMVWIHGGALVMGDASMYDGSALSAYGNVVVVTIQYRLGLFGFFSTGSKEAPGNWGLLDQVAALRWVQENIESFGGDPHAVTIFGESAGGCSVSAHVLSPLSKGLFHRAISESGVLMLPSIFSRNPEPFVKIVANISGCETSPSQMVSCLKSKTEEELSSLNIKILSEIFSLPVVIDGEFLPKDPEELLAGKELNAVPYLMGINNHEYGWAVFQALDFTGMAEGMDRETVKTVLKQMSSFSDFSPESVPIILEEYLGQTEDAVRLRGLFQDLMGDALFVVPTVYVARRHRDAGAPVYLYEYQHPHTSFRGRRPDFVKADHGDEVLSVFGVAFLKSGILVLDDVTEEEKELSRRIMEYWGNFARNGDPNGPGLVEWPRYDEEEGYLELNLEQKRAEKLKKDKVDFWLKTLPKKLEEATEESPKRGAPEVQVAQGRLRGQRVPIPGAEGSVDIFRGVPFARPPIGSRRFSRPEPPEPWSGSRDATSDPPACLQDLETGQGLSDTFTNRKGKVPLRTSEDCLYLNVFAPARSDHGEKLPVMVWIHGGGLAWGAAATYDGSALAAFEQVVVVAIQYRLGILGFYSTGDDHARGNWGLLDQVAALQWIQENIASFGGDPGSVVIFGESAGGGCVSAHVLSPVSKGLFHKAISQSGVALLGTFIQDHPEELAKRIAETAGCPTSSSSEMTRCLRGKTENEILEVTLKMDPPLPHPVLDGEFFPKTPKDLLEERTAGTVPYMIGVNDHEAGWLLPNMLQLPDLTKGLGKEAIGPLLKNLRQFVGAAVDHEDLIAEEYLEGAEDPLRLRDRLLELVGDASFVAPSIVTARALQDAGRPVYFYEFRHSPSVMAGLRPDFVKADHGDEIGFVFGRPFLAGEGTEEEHLLSKVVMKYWANFARSGDPNGEGLVVWPVYDGKEHYLEISLKPKAKEKLREKEVDFWTKVLPERIAESERGHGEL